MQAYFRDFPSVRFVGPLMLGLGLCVISGCAIASSVRSVSSKNRAAPTRVADSTNSAKPPEDVAGNQTEPDSLVFKARKTNSTKSSGNVSGADSTPGHSTEQLAAIGIPPASSPQDATSGVVAARHEVEQASLLEQGGSGLRNAVATNQGSTAAPTKSAVVSADYRSDRDGTDNAIQLQGLQLDDLTTLTPEQKSADVTGWPNRKVTTQALRPSVDSSGTGPIQANSQSRETNVDPWQAELDRLVAIAERDLASISPGSSAEAQAIYRRKQIQLRLLYLIAQHPEQAVTAIPTLPVAEQEYWQHLAWAITYSHDADDQSLPRERASHAISPLSVALRRLREQADLMIRNAGFCEEVSYFGNYKRFPHDEFVPGQPVLLYAEIENFRSEPTSSDEYRTLLRSIIEIQDASGQTRWNKTFDATEDLCRNPRRDYFHNFKFTIPESLRLGPHVLKLTVVDELSRKQSTCSIRFVVK